MLKAVASMVPSVSPAKDRSSVHELRNGIRSLRLQQNGNGKHFSFTDTWNQTALS